jgi:hypothetical protein
VTAAAVTSEDGAVEPRVERRRLMLGGAASLAAAAAGGGVAVAADKEGVEYRAGGFTSI